MSLRIDFWNKLNNKQAAKNQNYKSLLQLLQVIRPGSLVVK